MLRNLLAICLVTVALSCARKDAGKALTKLSGRSAEAASTYGASDLDSTFYIGYVDFFPDTREFFTAVYHREGHEYPDEDLLESKLDSVITLDDDWGRERLPMEEAKKMLVLDGLDTLAIFNRKHEVVCHCPLTRVEYVWDGLESYFVAVFKASESYKEQTEELYGISANIPSKLLTFFVAEELHDDTFNEFLLRKLEVARGGVWDMRHYKVTPPEAMYSVLSSWSSDGNQTRSYLTFFERNKVKILNEEVDTFHYLNILPVPVHMNGKPLLLVSAGYPSSDVLWDYLAGYDGTRYEAIDYNRVHMKQISAAWPVMLSQNDSPLNRQ